MTYAELKQKIIDYTEVSSNVFTDTILNGFIEDAELRILREVDSDNNRKYATASLVLNTRFIDTPEDLLIVRSAQIVDSDGTASADNRDFLQYRDTNFMAEFNPKGETGVPKYYSYWDEDTLVFAPTPDATYTIQINYILKTAGVGANTKVFSSQ